MECSVSESPYLLVILVTGGLKIWDLEARKLVLSSSIDALTNVRAVPVHFGGSLLLLSDLNCAMLLAV